MVVLLLLTKPETIITVLLDGALVLKCSHKIITHSRHQRVHNKDLCCTKVFPDLLKSTVHLSNPSWPNHLIYCTYKLWISTSTPLKKKVTCLCILFTNFLIFILYMMFAMSWRKTWIILLNSVPKLCSSKVFHMEFEKFTAASQTLQWKECCWGKI
jgi:hypothetical protein